MKSKPEKASHSLDKKEGKPKRLYWHSSKNPETHEQQFNQLILITYVQFNQLILIAYVSTTITEQINNVILMKMTAMRHSSNIILTRKGIETQFKYINPLPMIFQSHVSDNIQP